VLHFNFNGYSLRKGKKLALTAGYYCEKGSRVKKLFFPRELSPEEPRVAIVPDSVARLKTLGAEILVEAGIGQTIGVLDQQYESAGATVLADRNQGLAQADIVLGLRKPEPSLLKLLQPGQMLISHLDPFNSPDLIRDLCAQKLSSVAMELIPRSTIAQKMDALSSQANLGGYVAVLLAAQHLTKVIPMMMTPAGTIKPARFFIVGVGVAGLQAIATAKRLGARVDAFDTRPVVEEQVKSLGAKFVKIELGETGQTKDGYAVALTDEQVALQRQAMAKQCALSDVVITAAQVFGRRAPVIITREMLEQMRPGSVVVDTAIETGGNVEGSVADEIVEIKGVKIIGMRNLPAKVAVDASFLYSSNLVNFISHFWNHESKRFVLNRDDEIIQSALVTHEGVITSQRIRALINASGDAT
jgi:NAD(P) transhydrogenase subunit alpha